MKAGVRSLFARAKVTFKYFLFFFSRLLEYWSELASWRSQVRLPVYGLHPEATKSELCFLLSLTP